MPPEQIATTAVQEDVDVVGLSVMRGSPVILSSETIKELKKVGKEDVLVVVLGGILAGHDIPDLEKVGVKVGVGGIFITGTPIPDIVEFVRKHTSAAV